MQGIRFFVENTTNGLADGMTILVRKLMETGFNVARSVMTNRAPW
jgi:hypothetical protein